MRPSASTGAYAITFDDGDTALHNHASVTRFAALHDTLTCSAVDLARWVGLTEDGVHHVAYAYTTEDGSHLVLAIKDSVGEAVKVFQACGIEGPPVFATKAAMLAAGVHVGAEPFYRGVVRVGPRTFPALYEDRVWPNVVDFAPKAKRVRVAPSQPERLCVTTDTKLFVVTVRNPTAPTDMARLFALRTVDSPSEAVAVFLLPSQLSAVHDDERWGAQGYAFAGRAAVDDRGRRPRAPARGPARGRAPGARREVLDVRASLCCRRTCAPLAGGTRRPPR